MVGLYRGRNTDLGSWQRVQPRRQVRGGGGEVTLRWTMRGEARHSRGAALSTVTKWLIRVYTCGSDELHTQTVALQTEFSYNHICTKPNLEPQICRHLHPSPRLYSRQGNQSTTWGKKIGTKWKKGLIKTLETNYHNIQNKIWFVFT